MALSMARTIMYDFLDRGADECPNASASVATIPALLAIVFSFAPPVAAVLDRLTPAFRGLFVFQVRVVVGILIVFVAIGIAAWIIIAKHDCPGALVGSNTRHYSYRKVHRIVAKVALPLALFALLLLMRDLPMLHGRSVSLEGHVIRDEHGAEGVRVDFLNMDKEPLTVNAAITDSNGLFVADLSGDGGRAAFYQLSFDGDNVTTCRVRDRLAEILYGGEENVQGVYFYIRGDSCISRPS